MDSLANADRERIDGLAAFAAAAFALTLIVIAALERVGAPDAFVEAMGPLFALLALGVIGVLARAPSLNDFLVARRLAPAGYGGLAFAAVTAGFGLAFSSVPPTPTPWFGAGAGLIVAALLVGPAVRAAHVSSTSDWLATRFPYLPTRALFGAAGLAVALLLALVGYQLAIDALKVSIGVTGPIAEALTLAALILTTIPGGLKGLFWTDAASGGGVLLVALIGAGLAFATSPLPLESLGHTILKIQTAAHTQTGTISFEVAVAAGVAGFAPLIAPGLATRSSGQARLVGFGGAVLFALGLVATAIALPALSRISGGPPRSAEALIATAAWLPALALSRGGAFAASRALGLNLSRGYSKLTVLASRRIALSRLVALGALAFCFVLSRRSLISPGEALQFALCFQLVGVAPLLALALFKRASPVAGLITASCWSRRSSRSTCIIPAAPKW